jgi:hypothetical protein
MDVYYLEEIEQLRIGLSGSGVIDKKIKEVAGLMKAWESLRNAGKGWSWEIGPLTEGNIADGEDSEDEEGEYAPQVVET